MTPADLIARGFHLFPLRPNSKDPSKEMEGYPTRATRDLDLFRRWTWDPLFNEPANHNVAISTSRFGDDKHLLVIDVDVKDGKMGEVTLDHLAVAGRAIPPTFTQRTPTGGRHLVYWAPHPVSQKKMGSGLDVRAQGGYIVAAGSQINGGLYLVEHDLPVAPAPDWMLEYCGRASEPAAPAKGPVEGIDEARATARAIAYLENDAPAPMEGRNDAAYRAACKVKDFGLSMAAAMDVMETCWYPRLVDDSNFPLSEVELAVKHAYRYGKNEIGDAAPEMMFSSEPAPPAVEKKEVPVKKAHPFDVLNREFAFLEGTHGTILHETTDPWGKPALKRLSVQGFHDLKANEWMAGEKKQTSKLWMEDPKRRTFRGVVFEPGADVDPAYYNLWKGWAIQPAESSDHWAVRMFLDHLLEQFCGCRGDQFRYLVGFFAHLFQHPGVKPLVSCVFRGPKGVGKSFVSRCINQLVAPHFQVVSKPRQILGDFNGRLENCSVLTVEEAFWGGSKEAESVLKDLITGDVIDIERKYQDSYQIRNILRILIIGNERWLVPATADERRFAVFEVGRGKMQNLEYFGKMREGLEAGGYAALLRYLLDYDLTGINVNQAPHTAGLTEQKMETLGGVPQWWHSCLMEGRIIGIDTGAEGWPDQVDCELMRAAFRRWTRERAGLGAKLSDAAFGKEWRIALLAGDDEKLEGRRRDGGVRVRTYLPPPLDECRRRWDGWLQTKTDWEGGVDDGEAMEEETDPYS